MRAPGGGRAGQAGVPHGEGGQAGGLLQQEGCQGLPCLHRTDSSQGMDQPGQQVTNSAIQRNINSQT